MNIQVSTGGDHILFQVKGKLDSTTSLEFETVAESTVKENPVNMIFDLSGLTYISSSGLRVFLQLAKIAKQNSIELFLVAMQEPVKEIFNLAGFTPYFKLTDSVDEARTAIEN